MIMNRLSDTVQISQKRTEEVRYFEIRNTKSFMASLLTKDTFRDFELSSAQITTFMTYTVDGAMHEEYLAADGGDPDPGEPVRTPAGNTHDDDGKAHTGVFQMTPWPLAAPVIVSMIRGKTPPLSMKIILRLGNEPAAKLMSKADLSFPLTDIKGLFLNITCDREKVTCITGTSLSVFTTDKSVEHIWDEAAERFLSAFTED